MNKFIEATKNEHSDKRENKKGNYFGDSVHVVVGFGVRIPGLGAINGVLVECWEGEFLGEGKFGSSFRD